MKNYNYGGRSFAAGGAMPMEQLTEFNEGGRHEENSLGGIPQGMTPDGQQNLVEEGETKFDAENYIYSDSLKVDKELAEAFNLAPSMVGKTFADASKMAGRKKSKRQGDAIETAANEKDLSNLMEAQEAFKQARIEEKLQEIAELDPNALPALMGQGQPQEGAPQGDPAMGGQMQEAPMDEQAMMEQQMMAEQQQGGGGQPSPEEMAMMEQQQNQMMGQQEGMMRNGGYTTRSYGPGGTLDEILGDEDLNSDLVNKPGYENFATNRGMFPRVERTKENYEGMSDDQYFNNFFPSFKDLQGELRERDMIENGYDKYAPPSLYASGGFMGANPGMMNIANAGAMGTSGDPVGCKCADGRVSTQCCNRGYDSDDKGVSKSFVEDGAKNAGFRGSNRKLPFFKRQALKKADVNYGQNTTGIIGGTDSPAEYGSESSTAQNYANIDMSQYSPEEQASMKGAMWLNDPKTWAQANPGILNKKDLRQVNRVQDALSWNPSSPSNADFTFTPGERPGNDRTPYEENTKRENIQNFKDSHVKDGGRRYTHSNRLLNVFRAKDNKIKNSGNMRFAEKFARATEDDEGNNLRAASNLWQGVKDKSNLVGRFGEGKIRANQFGGSLNQTQPQGMNQMGSGGKMCYGCGGKMHAYGGRMDGIQHKYGAGMGLASDIVGAAGSVIGNIPGIGTAIGGALGGISGGMDYYSKKAAASETGKVSLKDTDFGQLALNTGTGIAGGALGTAGSIITSAASSGVNALTDSKTDKANDRWNDILKNPEKYSEEEFETALQRDKDKAKATKGMGAAGMAIGTIGNIVGGQVGKAAETGADIASDVAEVAADGVTENVTDTVGQLGDSMPIGNWADIDTGNMPEMPKNMATGGRMYAGGGYMNNRGRMMRNAGYLNFADGPVGEKDEGEFTDARPNIDAALEQTPLQKAALYAPIAKNLYDATLAKSDDYTPEFIPAEYVQLDSAQAIQQEKQRNAGLVAAGRAKGFNNPSTMLALNHALRGTVSNIQSSYDAKNSMLKQAALTSNNTQKKELAKLKQSLKMQTAEAKNLAMNEALSQAKEIAENKTSNKLSALYATMGAPDMGKNFITDNSKYKKLQKEFKKLQKEIKALKN